MSYSGSPPYGYSTTPQAPSSVPRVVIPPPPNLDQWGLYPQYYDQPMYPQHPPHPQSSHHPHHPNRHQQHPPHLQQALHTQPYSQPPPPPQSQPHFYSQPPPQPQFQQNPHLPPQPQQVQQWNPPNYTALDLNAQVPMPAAPPPPPSKLTKVKPTHDSPASAARGAGRDERVLLLALADEYISSARQLGALIAHGTAHASRQEYNKLMATGLACFEAVTGQESWQPSPRQAAVVRLRYCSLLYEETTDGDRIESVLGRTITFCETHRLLDLKFSAQHLLVRIISHRNRKAASSLLDRLIHEVTTCEYVPWIYALRFLKVSLCLQHSKSQDTHGALSNLRSLSQLARQKGDPAVSYAACVYEAMVLLQTRTLESVTEAQRALASARSQQANFGPTELPQLQALLYLADLVSCLDPYEPKQAQERLSAMQRLMDVTLKDAEWRKDRSFHVPFRIGDHEKLVFDTCGILGPSRNGVGSIAFSWLSRSAVYAIAFMLSGAATYSKSTLENNKTESFLNEALKRTSEESAAQDASPQAPLPFAYSAASSARELRCYILIQSAHAACNHSQWDAAGRHLGMFDKTMLKSSFRNQSLLKVAATYLRGVISQGTGDQQQALYYFQQPELSLDPGDIQRLTYAKFYAILAVLNILLIIHLPGHPQHDQIPAYVDRLRPHLPNCHQSPSNTSPPPTAASSNPHLCSAYSFLLAVLPQAMTGATANPGPFHATGTSQNSNSILPTKGYLQASMKSAKNVANSLMVTLCLNYMNHCFYRGIVGEQAMQAARIAKNTADHSGLALWRDVSEGVLQDTIAREEGIGNELMMGDPATWLNFESFS